MRYDEMTDDDRAAQRLRALRAGETQWGHTGSHRGTGAPDCPRERHHHHDLKCPLPTQEECLEAGVRFRKKWDSR